MSSLSATTFPPSIAFMVGPPRKTGKPESGGLKRDLHSMLGIMEPERVVINHCVFDTAIGACAVAWSERGLAAVRLPDRDRAATERRLVAKLHSSAAEPPPWVATLIADIRRY